MKWGQLRTPFLLVTFGGVLLVLGNTILLPLKDKSVNTTFVFPQKIPLENWQQVTTSPLPKSKQRIYGLISDSNYQYVQNNSQLNIEMRLLKDGNITSYMQTSIVTKTTIRKREGIGYYGLGLDGKTAFLTSCIDMHGNSTFSYEQFKQNRYKHLFNPANVLAWLLGKGKLRDQRCMWVYLSIPVQISSPEASYKTLENAWFPLRKWWQDNFPES
ncbi:MAG: cyanoexosortase A system-associated protein [Calothrix sp. C42_A2020_038]|nr:cyanoexosortase A system-associated protein [Calothrix sp. C42_A2020_038]